MVSISNTVQQKNPFQTIPGAPTKPISFGGVRPATQIGKFSPTIQQPQTIVQKPAQGLVQAPGTKTALGSIVPNTMQSPIPKADSQPLALQNQGGGLMTTPSGMPISGNPASFAGYTQPNQQPTQQPVRGLFTDVANSLARFSPLQTPAISDAYQKAQELNKALAESKMNEAKGTATILRQPIPIGDQEGQARVLQDQYLKQQGALAEEMLGQVSLFQGGLTGTGQQQQALSTVAGLAPEATRYDTFGSGTSGLSPATQAQKYAQEVASGARTYNDAVNAMGLYGNAGQQFLDQAIREVQPNFNFSQAQALAGVQGEVAPSLNMAQSALQNLQNTFAQTPAWQTTSIPVLNSLANVLGAVGIGTGTATSKANAINEARTQVANALGVMTNTTPTSWSQMVQQWFPDNATPDQVSAGIEQFNNLASNRQSIFGAPGQVQPFSPTSQGSSMSGGAVIQTSVGPISTNW